MVMPRAPMLPATNGNLALGHSVTGAVAGVAVHDDLGPGIEPANVVRGRPMDSIRYWEIPWSPARWPIGPITCTWIFVSPAFHKPPANAVLAKASDLQARYGPGPPLPEPVPPDRDSTRCPSDFSGMI
jgi:hypothetical protein